MLLWTDEYLNRLAEDAEIEISTRIPCIFHRFSLAVTADTSVYTINNDITGIVGITWKGYPVDPLVTAELYDSMKPLDDTVSSRPTHYVRYGYGHNKIKFWPCPNESINANDDSLSYKSGISSRVILSVWAVAVPTDLYLRVPGYIRPRIVRYYVLSKAFAKEGKGQNIKASEYYFEKYKYWLEFLRKITIRNYASRLVYLRDVHYKPEMKPPRPVLPPRFGIPV